MSRGNLYIPMDGPIRDMPTADLRRVFGQADDTL